MQKKTKSRLVDVLVILVCLAGSAVSVWQFWKELNADHYAATSADILQPVKPAFAVMQYADGHDAAIGYKGADARLIVMGYPFECIKGTQKQASIMQGIINYLLK